MSFKVGDSVLVIDENLAGVIKRIHKDLVTIETEDGFLLDFGKHELMKKTSRDFKNSLFSHSSAHEVISEKEKPKSKKNSVTRKKDRYEPTMEVDLHIHQLVPSIKGMTNYDMLTLQLETAKRQLEYAIRNRIQKVVFIHGVGEGVLKLELDYLFGRYNNVTFYDANYQKYGLGATEVYIYQNTPRNI